MAGVHPYPYPYRGPFPLLLPRPLPVPSPSPSPTPTPTWLAADDGVGADGLVGLELLVEQVAHAAHVHGLRLHLRVNHLDGLVAHALGLGDELVRGRGRG